MSGSTRRDDRADDRPGLTRVLLAMVAGSAAAALGALVLGEYEFEGALPWIAGPLFGLVIAEIVVSLGRWRDPAVGLFCAAAAGLGLVWAGWLDANRGVEPVKPLVWVAVGLGALAAFLRVVPLRRLRG